MIQTNYLFKYEHLFLLFLLLSMTFVPLSAATEKQISFLTSDNVNISASLYLSENTSGLHPAVILIHQGGSDRKEWGFLLEDLNAEGYTVLAYDVRGHGKSDKVDSIYELFNDPARAPKDLEAAVNYLAELPSIDKTRLAIIGTSIGANLACVGIATLGIKTAIAISGKTSAVHNLSGSTTPELKSIFYISSMESEGARANWARELYKATAEPHRIIIVEDSTGHGVEVFADSPTLRKDVIQWLAETL